MKDRSNQELRHDPDKLCHACNQAAIEFEHGSGLDMLKLLCFNVANTWHAYSQL